MKTQRNFTCIIGGKKDLYLKPLAVVLAEGGEYVLGRRGDIIFKNEDFPAIRPDMRPAFGKPLVETSRLQMKNLLDSSKHIADDLSRVYHKSWFVGGVA